MIHGEIRWCREEAVIGVTEVAYAESFVQRFLGLLARPRLEIGQGLVIKPCGSIHTFFMRYAIDVVFVGSDNKVIKIGGNVHPWRGCFCMGASFVVELAAGAAAQLGLIQGDECQCQ